MNWLRQANSEPLWKDEFSVHASEERYVTRRQLAKFLVLTSLGMFAGNVWLLTATLESFLQGNLRATLPAAIVSGVILLICVGLYLFVARVDSEVGT